MKYTIFVWALLGFLVLSFSNLEAARVVYATVPTPYSGFSYSGSAYKVFCNIQNPSPSLQTVTISARKAGTVTANSIESGSSIFADVVVNLNPGDSYLSLWDGSGGALTNVPKDIKIAVSKSQGFVTAICKEHFYSSPYMASVVFGINAGKPF